MKEIFMRVISIGIICLILFINLRTLSAYLFGKSQTASGHQVENRGKTGAHDSWGSGIMHKFRLITGDTLCFPKTYPSKPVNENKIILRLDDVSGSSSGAIIERIILDSQKYSAPMVLGVVPEMIKKNHALFDFLKTESCNLEFAIHGWDHFSAQKTTGDARFITEFSDTTVEDAIVRIENAKEVLKQISLQPIITLTPPYNIISNSGILAAKKSGIRVISSIGTGAFDVAIGENTFEKSETFDVSKTKERCKSSLEKNHVCVVLMRPEDFFSEGSDTIDEKIYAQFLGLLQNFSDNGYEFTTFQRLEKKWPDFSQYSITQ